MLPKPYTKFDNNSGYQPSRHLSSDTLTLSTDTYGYNNNQNDYESGTIYMKSRNFNAKAARFISQDSYPLFQRYSAFSGNPISNIDPLGKVFFILRKHGKTH